jgi:hypothetical protein
MSTTTTARKPRQRRPKVRTVNLLLPIGPLNVNGVLRLTEDGKETLFFVDRIASEIGGAGFRLTKFEQYQRGEEDAAYNVLLDGERSTCECKGHVRHGHCRHVDGLKALQTARKL